MRMQPRPGKTHDRGARADRRPGRGQLDAAAWANKKLTCAHCKRCTLRCEVLKEPDLDMGQVEEGYGAIAALPFDDQPAAVLQLVQDRPELYHALRRCCFCGFGTATCQTHVLAPERMRDWRVLFACAPGRRRLTTAKLVHRWTTSGTSSAPTVPSYGIGYPELASLEQAAEHGPGLADTLFFPGCSLVSYAPELTRTVGRWLTDNGVAWALSTDCCGSPLMSAGLFDRAAALRQRILDQIRAAGIVRVVTVCPGCGEEFVELMGDEVDIVPLPELLLQKSRAAERAGRPTGFAPLPERSVTFFDSCHDRFDGRHGAAIRALVARNLPGTARLEMDHRRKGTLCCGAGGAVAAYDGDVTERRVVAHHRTRRARPAPDTRHHVPHLHLHGGAGLPRRAARARHRQLPLPGAAVRPDHRLAAGVRPAGRHVGRRVRPLAHPDVLRLGGRRPMRGPAVGKAAAALTPGSVPAESRPPRRARRTGPTGR